MHKHFINVKLKQLCMMVIAFLLCPMWVSHAAPVGDAPDAGQVLRNAQQVERSLPSKQSPDVEVGETVRPPMVGNAGFKAKIECIVITGQDIFAQSEMDELLKDRVHKELSFVELNQAANIVAKYFKDHGYILAQAYLPAQEIENGKVEIAVLVGRYGSISLKNTSSVSDDAIKKQLTGLKSGSYINNYDLERAVLLAGDLAGVAAKIVLSPGQKPGTADVVVEAKKKEGASLGSISFNNWGTRCIGKNQGTLNYSFDNLAKGGDSLGVGITNAGSDMDGGNISYSLAIAEGTTFNIGYSKVNYSLGKEYAELDAHGVAYDQHIDFAWALKRSRDANLNFEIGYDHKRLQDFTDAADLVTEKWAHMASLGINGDSLDNLWGGGANAFSVMWYKGSLGAQSNALTPPVGNWQKTTYNLIRQQYLANRLTLKLAFSGQIANTNLDTSEKFSLGGANGVRAYPTNEASGDDAWLLSSELHWSIPVKSENGLLQLIGFYDTGVSILEKNPTVPDGNRKALAGKGLGFSWAVPGEYGVQLYYAWKAGSTQASEDTDKNGRLWIQGIKYF